MKAANKWHNEGIFDTLGGECSREAKDGEVWASSHLSKKPVPSQENTCKDNCLVVKELTSKEDGEVWASSCHSK
eukprot:4186637-Ditylum_brightwellii.AAC.1